MADAGRTSAGCWTCKVRRKKCDGTLPVCSACSGLQLTCYSNRSKPDWMDGGPRQEDMAASLKTQIKENGHRRRAERSIAASSNRAPLSTAGQYSFKSSAEWIVFTQDPSADMDLSMSTQDVVPSLAVIDTPQTEIVPAISIAKSPSVSTSKCALASRAGLESREMGRADTNLMMFYLESLFPFLFPFHQPSVLQGGRAWILDLMLKSPVVRQAMLCQSSYYLSLAHGSADHEDAWEMVLAQTKDAFFVLRQTLEIFDREGITPHVHGAVRTLASIMQLQRFEVAVSSFSNCRAHLSACISLFRQLLDISLAGAGGFACPSSCFDAVIRHLGPSSWILGGKRVQVSSSEQDAFRFSAALLIFDDIIASTALQEVPQLYSLHRSLLTTEGAIDLKGAMGCENWVMVEIGESVALDAWKQQCRTAGSLDIVELVQRAMAIKCSIENNLALAGTVQATSPQDPNQLLKVLSTNLLAGTDHNSIHAHSSLVTRIWAHAALLHLSVVVSGWQPANNEVRMNVQQIFDLLVQLSPTALLRTVCWPVCVAGCLAEPGQEAQFRGLVQNLQPRSVFGTLYRALDIMEKVWRDRETINIGNHDLAACFRNQDELILLV